MTKKHDISKNENPFAAHCNTPAAAMAKASSTLLFILGSFLREAEYNTAGRHGGKYKKHVVLCILSF
jgi:hypothetical protein